MRDSPLSLIFGVIVSRFEIIELKGEGENASSKTSQASPSISISAGEGKWIGSSRFDGFREDSPMIHGSIHFDGADNATDQSLLWLQRLSRYNGIRLSVSLMVLAFVMLEGYRGISLFYGFNVCHVTIISGFNVCHVTTVSGY